MVDLATLPHRRDDLGLTGRPPADLAFRLHGTEYDGRVVRLKSAKCTIGSAKNCTLRLHARGVAPVHCLIVRGAHGAVVRRWAVHTRLNDANFHDAPLNVGDRLSLGPVELEVIEGSTLAPAGPSSSQIDQIEQLETLTARLLEAEDALAEQTRKTAEEQQRRETLESETETLRQQVAAANAALSAYEQRRQDEDQQSSATMPIVEFDRCHEEWAQERTRLTNELDALRQTAGKQADVSEDNDSLAALTAANAELEQRLQAALDAARADSEQWEQKLGQLTAEMEHRRLAHEQKRLHAVNELAELQRKMDEQATFTAEFQDLNVARSELEQERQALAREREHAEREAADRQAQTERRESNLAQRESEIEQRWTELRQLEAHLGDREAELSRREAEFKHPPNLSQHQTDSAADRPCVEPPLPAEEPFTGTMVLPRRESINVPPHGPRSNSQESAAELLARLGYATSWDQAEDQVEATAAAAPQPSAAQLAAPSVVAGATPSEMSQGVDEDESIEDYMSRLLQRVRGDDHAGLPRNGRMASGGMSPRAARPSQTTPQRTTLAASATPAGGLASILGGSATASDPAAPMLAPEEFLPRSRAPERSAGLSAMRDLANNSARSAIGRYSQTRLTTAIAKLAMSLGAAGVCVFLGNTGWRIPIPAYAGAALAGMLSLVWLGQSVQYTRRYFRVRREKPTSATQGEAPSSQ